MLLRSLCLVAVAALAAACGAATNRTDGTGRETIAPPALPHVAVELVARGFDSPVAVVAHPDHHRLYVIEQHTGAVRLVDGTGPGATAVDLGGRISRGAEQGLLGIAFPPDGNDVVFLDYTDRDGRTIVGRFDMRGTLIDRSSEQIVLQVEQPYANHNGGNLVFGPDGHLWVGLGDGGGADDPQGRAQDPQSLLGKMLRIDVVRPGAPPQIWASGLRNPWRYAFDGTRLWIGDVGQAAVEEIDRVDASAAPGANFGWDLWEGSTPHENPDGTVPARYVTPIAEYTHADGCSVTGGHVVRDASVPALDGRYVFADYCSGRFWALPADAPAGTTPEEITGLLGGPIPNVTSFGLDGDGHTLLVVGDGRILRLRGAS